MKRTDTTKFIKSEMQLPPEFKLLDLFSIFATIRKAKQLKYPRAEDTPPKGSPI